MTFTEPRYAKRSTRLRRARQTTASERIGPGPRLNVMKSAELYLREQFVRDAVTSIPRFDTMWSVCREGCVAIMERPPSVLLTIARCNERPRS